MGQIRRVICEDHTAGAPNNVRKPRPEASSCDANPWPGRAQRRTPKAQPQSETAQTMPSTKPRRQVKPQTSLKHNWGTKRTFPKPRRLAPPKKNRTKETHPTTNSMPSRNTNMKLSVPSHRDGPVHASPQIWTCPCLPQMWTCLCLSTTMGLPKPPNRYGPADASPQKWTCLSHRYGPVFASQQLWACLCLYERHNF